MKFNNQLIKKFLKLNRKDREYILWNIYHTLIALALFGLLIIELLEYFRYPDYFFNVWDGYATKQKRNGIVILGIWNFRKFDMVRW